MPCQVHQQAHLVEQGEHAELHHAQIERNLCFLGADTCRTFSSHICDKVALWEKVRHQSICCRMSRGGDSVDSVEWWKASRSLETHSMFQTMQCWRLLPKWQQSRQRHTWKSCWLHVRCGTLPNLVSVMHLLSKSLQESQCARHGFETWISRFYAKVVPQPEWKS